ncbi:MAG: hypothetical protein P4L43_20235 [Syntrophobacteraceae bacterium]|nr:hypothetical protein [Syntrophobacteraceae bacterium]
MIHVLKALLDWREFLLYYIMIVVFLGLLGHAVAIGFEDRGAGPNFRPESGATLAVCLSKGTQR